MAKRAALFRPVAVVVLALLGGALACNLRVNPDKQAQNEAELPNVTILDPAEGTRVNKGQDVLVKARAVSSTGVTLVELLVNGVRVDSQIPADALSLKALDVVLDYKADQAGIITLGVRAYSNGAMGQTVQRTITVIDPLNPGQGTTTGTGTPFPTARPGPTFTPNPLCRARINTGLNFRKGPGTDYAVISTFAAGLELPIAGYSDRSDGRWWQIASGGQYGWISAAYTTQLGDCSLIRPAAAPASPTPIPTATPLPTVPGITSTPTLPDLVFSMFEGVTDLTLGIDGTAQATYIIRVKNQGGQMSGQFVMAVALPSGDINTFDVPGLNPGQEFQVPSTGLNITYNKPGATRLLLTVDFNNVVAESNEGNNQTYKDIVVNPAPATQAPQTNNSEAIPPVEQVAQGGGPDAAVALAGALQSAEVGISGEPAQIAVWQGHTGKVAGLSFSPAGSYIASASLDGTARLWSIDTGIEQLILVGHTDRVVSVDFSGDGSYVVSGSWDGTARVWDVASGAEVARFDHGAEVNAVAFSPGGTLIATGGDDGRVVIWQVSDQSKLWEFYAYGPVSGVALPTDDLLIVASRSSNCANGDGALERYELTNGTLVDFFEGHSKSIQALAINYGGTIIAGSGQAQLCAGDQVIWVWDGTGTLLQTLDQGSVAPIALALNPMGSLLAASSADGSVRLWDVAAGTQLYVLTGHNGEASSVAFSPDSTILASGGADNTVRLWAGF